LISGSRLSTLVFSVFDFLSLTLSACRLVGLSPCRTLLALCFLLVPVASRAEGRDSLFVVSRVVVEGHESFSTRDILETVAIESGTAVSRTETLRRLETLLVQYRESGFPRAQVVAGWEPVQGGQTELHLSIEEGAPHRIDALSLDGCHGLPCSYLEALIESREGGVLRRRAFLGDVDRILDAYEDQGYPYVRVEPGAHWSGAAGISLRLAVIEGPRVTIEEIRIHGNETTRDGVVQRECGIAPGDLYSQRKIDRVAKRVRRLGFFDEVRAELSLRDPSGPAVLDVKVTERKTNSVYGAVGYVPRETEEGYLTGVLDLSFGNIAGTGRSARVRWRTYQPGAFEWTFSYDEPWVLGIPLTGEVSIHQEVRDSTFTRTVGEIGFEYPLGDRFWGRVAGRSEGVTAGSGGKGVIRGSRRRSVNVGMRWDVRDDSLNPRRGFRWELGLEYGRKNYEGDALDPVRAVTYSAREDIFVPLARRHVLAFVSMLWWLDSSEWEIPEHEQFRVGGSESLRGYGEDEFYGWRVFTLTTEYRVLLGRRSRVHVFVDGGHLDRRLPASGGSVDREEWLLGYGFGLRSESRLGMIGVDFGLAKGEPLTEGKIHLRLEGEF
jgi:outer membrane protein assembly factor BamA